MTDERRKRLAEAWDKRQQPGEYRLIAACLFLVAVLCTVAAWMWIHNVGGL